MTAIAQVDIRTARQRAGQIRQGIHNYLETLALIQQAWNERDWETLGYDSWDQYVETEFSDARLRLPAEHRQKAVTELRLAGMSQRAIGSTLGIGVGTVNRDLAGVPDGTPAVPDRATGLDGKRYAATQPARNNGRTDDSPATEPDADQPDVMNPAEGASPRLGSTEAKDGLNKADDAPASEAGDAAGSVPGPTSPAATEPADGNGQTKDRRRPITDTFRDAVLALTKDIERLERIVLDDRWPRNAAKAAPASRNDLRRAVDLLAAVADRVPN